MTEAKKLENRTKKKKKVEQRRQLELQEQNDPNVTTRDLRLKKRLEALQAHEPKPTLVELRRIDKPNCLSIKRELFVSCGRICMSTMEKFPAEKLVLHHEPPFRDHPITEFDNSFILSEDAHGYLTELEIRNPEKYASEMARIRRNKVLLLEKKAKR